MATKGKDGALKIRKGESTGRRCIADKKLVTINLSVTEEDKNWLDSFGKGKKSEKAREILLAARLGEK